MTIRTGGLWTLSVFVSVGVHLGALFILVLIVEPEPLEDRPLPNAQVNVEALEVKRSVARPSEDQSEALQKGTPQTTSARQGAVRQSSAIPITPPASSVAASPARGKVTPLGQSVSAPLANISAQATTLGTAILEQVTPVRQAVLRQPKASEILPSANALAPSSVKGISAPQSQTSATPLAKVTPTATVIDAATAPLPVVTASPVQTQTAKPTVAPSANISPALASNLANVVEPSSAKGFTAPERETDATLLANFVPDANVIEQSTAPMPVFTAGAPQIQTDAPLAILGAEIAPAAVSDIARESPALELPAERQTAALAWSGDVRDVVESTSLTAMQAFMRPGDISDTKGASEVREGIADILGSVPCARLQTTFNPDTGQLELRGHVPKDSDRGPVLAALRQQVGGAIPVADNLLILPRPQCGALAGISEIGLPQSTEQLTNPRVIGTDGHAQNFTYQNGARLTLDLVAPDYDGYVYVDFFAADATVIHLQPNSIVPLELSLAKTPLSVGRDRGDLPSLNMTIAPPFGQEIAAAFATSVPLYEGERPLQEPAEPYIAFLKERVEAARKEHADFKGEWVYFFITTRER